MLWIVLLAWAAAGRDPGPPPEDPVVLAGVLVRDGDWERASEVLDGVDADAKGVDRVRLHTLRGLVELHQQRPADAVGSFEAALAVATEGRELLELHLARACLGADDPLRALAALERTGEVGRTLPGTFLLRAQAEEASGRPDRAWLALDEGARRFPDQPELARQQVFLLVRLGLFREARERGEALLVRPDADADDAVAISEALRRGGEASQAAVILEAALLEEGEDRDLLVQAARAAIDAGRPRAAARFLERATVLDPTLALEAAEAWRRAGDPEAALRMNGLVEDPVAKARQRLGLLLESETFDRALALEERLVRLGLADDDAVAYGLAYAAFREGEVDRAEQWLGTIVDPAMFQRGTELREAMAGCGACR